MLPYGNKRKMGRQGQTCVRAAEDACTRGLRGNRRICPPRGQKKMEEAASER